MDNSNTLDRLNGQVAALIGALQQAREENARLGDELSACQDITRQREARVNELEEQLGLKDMELEDLAVRIESVLGESSETTAAPAPAEAAAETRDTLQPA